MTTSTAKNLMPVRGLTGYLVKGSILWHRKAGVTKQLLFFGFENGMVVAENPDGDLVRLDAGVGVFYHPYEGELRVYIEK